MEDAAVQGGDRNRGGLCPHGFHGGRTGPDAASKLPAAEPGQQNPNSQSSRGGYVGTLPNNWSATRPKADSSLTVIAPPATASRATEKVARFFQLSQAAQFPDPESHALFNRPALFRSIANGKPERSCQPGASAERSGNRHVGARFRQLSAPSRQSAEVGGGPFHAQLIPPWEQRWSQGSAPYPPWRHTRRPA